MMDPELLPSRDNPPPLKAEGQRELVITHSPTFRHTKGTQVAHQAMRIIRKKKLPISIEILENKPWQESLDDRAQGDIYFDQVFWGHYGVASVEAMMMGMPVMAWISNYTYSWDPVIPIINVKTAESIVLQAQYLLEYPDTLQKEGKESQDWAIKHHDMEAVCRKWYYLIEWAAEGQK